MYCHLIPEIHPQNLTTALFYICTGWVQIPNFAYKESKAAFVFCSLLTKQEVICVLSDIRSECNKVATMRLFNVTSIKPLRLDEFEVIQSQMQTQVLLYCIHFFK